jgi:hypothetical protein
MAKKQDCGEIFLAGSLILLLFVIGTADAAHTITIFPLPDHNIGDLFPVRGTTDLDAGSTIIVEVTSASFKPTQKGQSGEFSGASGTVTVIQGPGGINSWSFNVDSSTFKAGEYIVKASSSSREVTATPVVLYMLTYTPTKTVATLGVTPVTRTPSPSMTLGAGPPITTTLGPTVSTTPQITGTVGPPTSTLGTTGGQVLPVDPVITILALLCMGLLITGLGRR